MDKKQLRKKAYAYFKEMPDEVYLERTKEVMEFITKFPKFLEAKKVGIYYPIHKEINLLMLMHLFPDKSYYFPRLDGKSLSFRKITDITELENAKFNTKQPKKHHTIEKNIDIYFIPCVATHQNYRIGHGKGYYDYYFQDHQGYKVGIVHHLLKNQDIKMDNYDIPMDYII